MDRPHHRYCVRGRGSARNFHAGDDLSRGRLYHLCRLRHRRKYNSAKLDGSAVAIGRKENVPDVGAGMGKQSVSIHCAGYVSHVLDLLPLWRADPEKSPIPDQILIVLHTLQILVATGLRYSRAQTLVELNG